MNNSFNNFKSNPYLSNSLQNVILKCLASVALLMQLCISGCGSDDAVTNGSQDPPNGINTVDLFPLWSNLNGRIYFKHHSNVYDSIGIYEIDTSGNFKNLLISDDGLIPTDVSPDGSWILMNSVQIYKWNVSGGSTIEISANGKNARWSPDGTRIAFNSVIMGMQDNLEQLCLMNSDGSDKRAIGFSKSADWFSNNENLIIIGDNEEVRKISINDSAYNELLFNIGNLTSNYRYCDNISLSHDNTKVYFIAMHKNVLNYQLFSVNIDGTSFKQLSTDQCYSYFLNDERNKIVYTNSSTQNGYLWIMDTDGGNSRQLTYP